jgi:hypothetical protein
VAHERTAVASFALSASAFSTAKARQSLLK